MSAPLRLRRNAAGFSLIEVIVALAITVGLMLGASQIYWQQKTVSRRLAGQRIADRALENKYEELRAGLLALVDATFPPEGPGEPTIVLTVSDGTIPSTWQVDLIASYRVDGKPFRRTLTALVRP